jgi:uncharacterized protein
VPANLTPEYHDAEERFKAAVTAEEKVAALEEMLRVIPKHKGTEKMQGDLKRRLSKVRKEFQKEKASGGPKRPFYYIEREGIGRAALCGPPNAGKSDMLSRLTHARPEVADYPFTTRFPQPGMMRFEDVQIQLVDTPPLAPEVLEPWQVALIEQADLAVLLFDVTDPGLLDQTDFVLDLFEKRGIQLFPREESRVLVLGNKMDRAGALDNFEAWRELFSGRLDPEAFSVHMEEDLLRFRTRLFEMLKVVRVYTKPPGAKPDRDQAPFVLRKGSTVLDAAAAIHKDLADRLRFARIWGGGKFDGQMVERDYILQDGDLIEVHA